MGELEYNVRESQYPEHLAILMPNLLPHLSYMYSSVT